MIIDHMWPNYLLNHYKYLNKNKLNKFTINKAISKCRDSYRVTKEDKEMLLQYKKI